MKRHNTRRFKIAELEARLGVSRQTVWRWYSNGDFPKPHYLGQHRLWFEHDVEQWEETQMAAHASRKKVCRGASDKEIAEACTADSFYTMSGSSPPNATSSKGGAK